jgi:dipeptidyl aminopeptidase/acylaminoacyl peptidase
MRSPAVTRREFLLAATVTAGLLRPGRAAGQSSGREDRPAPALIPRRVLFGDADRSWARISPDGQRIAFLAPVGGVLNLWVGSISDVGTARPVTRVTDRSLSFSFQWLHDNRHLVVFREQGGDENWQAHAVDLQTGEVRPLTPGPGVTSSVQQISRHVPGELLMAHNQRDARFFDVYRVNAATGASILVETNEGFLSYVTDAQLRVRLAVRSTNDGGVEYLQRGKGGDWEPFTRLDMADIVTTRAIGFSDDGRELYWLDSRGRDKAVVVAQEMATGAVRVLAEDARADFVDLARDPSSGRPVAAMAEFTRRRWQVVDPAYAADYARLARASSGDLVDLTAAADNKHWVAYFERDTGPGQVFHYDRAARKVRLLFTMRPALARAPLVAMEPRVVRTRDGLHLVCYLSRPRGAGRRPLPTVLAVHGGPWGRDQWGLSPIHQWLANRGYAVLSVNFRGSTGFGKSFVNAANLEWAGKMHDDLIDATDWAIAQGIADPRRVAIFGGSYGGYAALVGLTFTPEKFACAVDLYGIANLVTFLDTIPPYFKPWRSILKVRTGDDTTEAGRRFLRERSPLFRAHRIVRPLLIGQGANDVRVTPSESDQIVRAMQERGIPVTYVSYADEGHGFRRPENRRSFSAVVELFLARHLGGRHEPLGDDFKGSTIEFKTGRDLIPGLGV